MGVQCADASFPQIEKIHMIKESDSIPLCLIGGTGRSGTTVLKNTFERHPKCVSVPEYRFPIDPDGLVDFYLSSKDNWSPYLFDKKIKRLRRLLRSIGRNNVLLRGYGHYMQKFGIENWLPTHLVPAYCGIAFSRRSPNFNHLVDALISELTEFSYSGAWNGTRFLEKRTLRYSPPDPLLAQKLGSFWHNVIGDVCDYQNASYFIEDNTWNILWFDTILQLLPNAKLVHVLRDPRDVVASYMKMRWSPNDAAGAAKWYKGLINRWFQVRESIPQSSFKEIHLNELVGDPRGVLQEVSDFWGIPWSETLLQQSFGKSHTGRWKKEFSKKDQGVLHEILGKEIAILGYEI